MESITAILQYPLVYVLNLALAVIAYFARNKLNSIEKKVSDLEIKMDQFSKDASNSKLELLQLELHTQKTYVDKVEYTAAQNRVYSKLDEMGNDIKTMLINNKADKG